MELFYICHLHMKIYSALQIGEYHTNHCEDYYFIGNIGSDKTLCAVMDGCTMGTDSYFVSTLVGKLLRKITIERDYQAFYNTTPDDDIDQYLKSIIRDLFKELNVAANQLMLEKRELLTTLIMLLVDKKTDQGILLAIGDGLVSINGQVTEFDHDNKPDYIGFHLTEDFETWYAQQQQKLLFKNIQDVSIATDGIFMFTPFKKIQAEAAIDPISFLLSDNTNADNDDMLQLKLKQLEYQFGLKPTDDIAILRLIV